MCSLSLALRVVFIVPKMSKSSTTWRVLAIKGNCKVKVKKLCGKIIIVIYYVQQRILVEAELY